MRALRRSQSWEAEAGGPAGAGLVLTAGGKDRTKETQHTVKATGVLNTLN